jgi:CoA-dependent NAD(P)H sulfur oxidoreductase
MRLLVIGGVAAGLSAAARARRLDPSLEIIVLEKGPAIAYGACGLPYFLEGRVRELDHLVVYTPEYFRKERNITVRTGACVTAIAHARREVLLERERVHYDRLVIATGARHATHLPGADLPHVFTLQTMHDAARLKQYLTEKKPRRAVIIGASYIGLEVADALRRGGLAVTILEQTSCALNREDAQLTSAVRSCLERYQVELRCGVRAEAIEAGQVAGVPCDLVIVAAGLRPNAQLAVDAGVELGRTGAIRVDERMETGLTGVYAAGDCAEANHLVLGRAVWLPLGTTANKMGRVAGANAAGSRERFPGIVGTSILRVFDCGIAMTGLSDSQARREGYTPVSVRIEAPARAAYFGRQPMTVELTADRQTARLLGASITGEGDSAMRINVVAAALHAHMKVHEFEQLDLAYAPPFAPVWDPLLIAAQQLARLL